MPQPAIVGTAQPQAATALQQQTSASSSAAGSTAAVAATSASAEEEAYKRNTDCVYFLASPLTCKKGSDCEYRHSDTARVNPRDCWYWMHGNCLNPKCAFRHPPLDGLLGTQVPNAMGASVPQSQAPSTATLAGHASGKQAVPCIFFQKGLCLKGDWCQFSHALNSVSNKVLQAQAVTNIAEPLNSKQTFGRLEKFTQENKVQQTNIKKSIQIPQVEVKPVAKFASAPAKNEVSIKKTVPPASAIDDKLHRYSPVEISPVDNDNQVKWSNVQQPVSLIDRSIIDGKDTEEVSREPSPGFDVLVDDELRDCDYYHRENQFGGAGEHEGRNEYYDSRSGDYGSMVDADRDIYHESHGYDSYDRLEGHHTWEQRRSSSERMSGASAHLDRRRYSRTGGDTDQVDESDLRHHISKHRRANGLRSVIHQDYPHERLDDRGYQNSHRGGPRHERERQEGSLGGRLRGRIKIPLRSSSSADGNDLRRDREIECRRDHSGISQGRLHLLPRLRDRIKGNVEEDDSNEGRNNRGLHTRRDTISDNNADFAGPKSLAELRSRKNIDSNEQHVNERQLRAKRKHLNLEYQQLTGGELSFDGPRPLEEILKRKRGSGTAVSGSGTSSGDNDDYARMKREESSMKTKAGAEAQISPSGNDLGIPNERNSAPAVAQISPSRTDLGIPNELNSAPAVMRGTETALSFDGLSSHARNASEAEVEDAIIVEDGAEDQEPETYDHGDQGADYEQGDGEDYNSDEGDNGDPGEEYLEDDDDDDEDDDGDDFAKKMGVMY